MFRKKVKAELERVTGSCREQRDSIRLSDNYLIISSEMISIWKNGKVLSKLVAPTV